MNDFDSKWQTCAARARQAPPRDNSAPFGFATRVMALAARPRDRFAPAEVVWQRLSWRWLAAVLVLLALCAAMEGPHLRDSNPLQPGVENAVAELIWSL